MRHPGFMLLPTIALFLACSDASGPDDAVTETFDWDGQIPPAGTVEIKNTNGDVRARPSEDGRVRVHVLKEGRDDDPSTVRIDVLETAQGVTICAVYPDVPGQPPNECLPGLAAQLSSQNNDVSVTFDVEVPAGRAFIGWTVGGAVDASGLDGHVEARTVAGDIDISTTGTAEAATIDGDITASIGRVAWDQDLAFRAVSGDVRVSLPANTNADVWGSTANGSITTDFPLHITRLGVSQQLQGRLGSGGRNLRITTVGGDIALRSN